jgi:hypothetical protein
MRYPVLLLVLGLVACDSTFTNTPEVPIGVSGGAKASLRVVNTSSAVSALDVLVGGKVVISNLAFGDVSAATSVATGTQQVAFRPSGGTAGPATALPFTAGDTTTILTVDSSTIINPWVLTDTGAVVPAGFTKLRVVNFAADAGSLLAWRTQPDFPVFSAVQFPFPYKTASPYVQSDPGNWQVLVATEAYDNGQPVVTDTLALSDSIAIADGESRTVIIVDNGSGGVALVVISP